MTTDFKPVNDEKFTIKDRDILEKNRRFFASNRKYLDTMLEIIQGESEISIRILDYFVSNYSRKNSTFYCIKVNGRQSYFHVNNEYKNQLNGYSKRYFDSFCRKKSKKVIYSYQDETNKKNKIIFLTSIGQLNFFQWALRNKVIVYVERHLSEIENDMKEFIRQNKIKKANRKTESEDSDSEDLEVSAKDEIDTTICSSDSINSLRIHSTKSSKRKNSGSKRSDSDKRRSRRCQNINPKHYNIPVRISFD